MDDVKPQSKPFLDYDQLVDLLIKRGMVVEDKDRAIRKLAQVGYYRLSGYWHTARRYEQNAHSRTYLDIFRNGTSFNGAFEFYLFDKCLRVEFLNALERTEIYFRTVFAHEIGRENPLAYLDPKTFAKHAFNNKTRMQYRPWLERHNRLIAESHEESIIWHRSQRKAVPIWVAAEAWDFGQLSKFYSMLTGRNQDLICNRLNISERKTLDNWLINLNILRNRCAHHSRVCNRPNARVLILPKSDYFEALNLSTHSLEKLYGMICVIWFLLSQIGPNSSWLLRIKEIIESMPLFPGLTHHSLGIPEESIFNRI